MKVYKLTEARPAETHNGDKVMLAPQVEAGEVACTGEAHSNPYIDNCMVCAPRWGWVMSYVPLTPDACREGFAVPINAADRVLFAVAELAGTVKLVSVTQRFGRKGKSSCTFNAYVAAEAR